MSDVWDIASTLVKMLAPVVEKPEAVSNIASVNEGISFVSMNGMHPQILSKSHERAVATQPSFRKIVMFLGFLNETRNPASMYIAERIT